MTNTILRIIRRKLQQKAGRGFGALPERAKLLWRIRLQTDDIRIRTQNKTIEPHLKHKKKMGACCREGAGKASGG